MTKHKRPHDDPPDEERNPDLDPEAAADVGALDPELADAQRVAAEWKQKHDEVQDRYTRALADADNARKRMLREVDTSRQFAVEKFARDLLQVTDNLRRALEGVPADRADDPVVAGVKLVEDLLTGVLANHGVKPIDAQGKPFDPNFHEAIATDERDDVPSNTVTTELVRGWTINDRLLRPAMVRVSRPPSARAEGA